LLTNLGRESGAIPIRFFYPIGRGNATFIGRLYMGFSVLVSRPYCDNPAPSDGRLGTAARS
jgi:hypothetical protein